MFEWDPDPTQIYGSADKNRKKHLRIRDIKYNKKAMLPILDILVRIPIRIRTSD
jgi:hypothetical protein